VDAKIAKRLWEKARNSPGNNNQNATGVVIAITAKSAGKILRTRRS